MVYKGKPIFRSAIFYLLVVLVIGIIFLIGFKKSNVFAQVGDIPFAWGTLTNTVTDTDVSFDNLEPWMFAVHRTSYGCPPQPFGEPPLRQTDEADFVEFLLYKSGNPNPLTLDWVKLKKIEEWYENSAFECWGETQCDSNLTCQIKYDVFFDINFSDYGLTYGEHWIIRMLVRKNS